MTVELEERAASIADVSFPRRTIDLIVMPYEQMAEVWHHGRKIEEIVTRGAFGNIERGSRRVAVNLHHDQRELVGKATRFQPSRAEGLVAEVRIAKTGAGDDALAWAADELVDASAGFQLKTQPGTDRVEPQAEVWETRSRRRLNKLWLHHIALTPDPAYQGARVLAVRNTEQPPEPPPLVETPHRDEWQAWLLEQRLAKLEQA